MKYTEAKELQAQIQLLNDIVQAQNITQLNQDKKIQELEKQAAGVDEQEEKLRDECLEADLKSWNGLPKQLRHYRNQDEFEKEWVAIWEEDPRLLEYREKKVETALPTPTKPKSDTIHKRKHPTGDPKRIVVVRKEVQHLVGQGYSFKDIGTLTGVGKSTISNWTRKYGWDRNLPDGAVTGKTRLAPLDVVEAKQIPLITSPSKLRMVWKDVVNEEKIISWFKENNVTDEDSEMWNKDIAAQYAAYVGLDEISRDIASNDRIGNCSSMSNKYYNKLGKVNAVLVGQGVLNKTLGHTNTWQVYGDVLGEDGEPVIGDDGYVLQELKPRASRMNIFYLNLGSI